MGLDKMKKIMYFITTSEWGGASQYVYNLCKFEKDKGNKVYLAVGSQGELSNRVKELQIPVFIVKSVKRSINPVSDIKAIFEMRELIKRINPDILHLNSSKAGIIGRVACKSIKHQKAKVVFTVHGWAFTDGVPSKFKKSLFRSAEKIVSGLADLFICVSKYDQYIGKRDKVLNNKTNSVVIYNGSQNPNSDLINYTVHNPLKLVMVARFSPQKNQKLLIEALKKINPNSYQLTFVGDGETLIDCKRLVEQLSLSNSINFVGFKKDVGPYLVNNDVYILTTHYEGLPISIIEAMSYGLPILASDVGGNSELVTNNVNGYLVNNVNELVNSILRLISNPDRVKDMGKKSRVMFQKKFTLNKSIEGINMAYEKLLKK